MIVILTIFMISLFFQMFLLIFLLVGLSGIPALDLDSHDKTRFILTYCHLVRDKPVSSTFNLESACLVSIGFFGESVCVRDPSDDDAFVEGTCLSVRFVRKAAKTFCARTTTPLPTSTSTSTTASTASTASSTTTASTTSSGTSTTSSATTTTTQATTTTTQATTTRARTQSSTVTSTTEEADEAR